MSDQQPPAQQDTAAVAGPTEAPGTAQQQAEVNWEKRYQDLHPEYTRTTQQVKELEQKQQWYELLVTSDDPDTQRQAAAALGYDIPDQQAEDVEPAEYEDPYDELRTELGSVRERLDQQDQMTRQEAENEFISGYARSELEKLGVTDEDSMLWIFERALGLPNLPPPPGAPAGWVPDVKAAFEQFQAWETGRQKQWARTKQAPYVPSGGRPATEVPDPGHGQQARLNRAMWSLQNSVGDE